MKKQKLDRRKFLRYTSLSALGATGVATRGLASGRVAEEEAMLRIREYRTFGRTGFRVSVRLLLAEAQENMDLSVS